MFFCKGGCSWGREKLLFAGKEVSPFPKPHPSSRKAGYFWECTGENRELLSVLTEILGVCYFEIMIVFERTLNRVF